MMASIHAAALYTAVNTMSPQYPELHKAIDDLINCLAENATSISYRELDDEDLQTERTAGIGEGGLVDYERIGEVVRLALAESHKPVDCVETNGHGGAEIMQEVGKMRTATRSESRYWRLDRAADECMVATRTFAEWLAGGEGRVYKI